LWQNGELSTVALDDLPKPCTAKPTLPGGVRNVSAGFGWCGGLDRRAVEQLPAIRRIVCSA